MIARDFSWEATLLSTIYSALLGKWRLSSAWYCGKHAVLELLTTSSCSATCSLYPDQGMGQSKQSNQQSSFPPKDILVPVSLSTHKHATTHLFKWVGGVYGKTLCHIFYNARSKAVSGECPVTH